MKNKEGEMIGRGIGAFLICFGTTVGAQDWQSLDGAEIRGALEGQTLVYGGGWQEFRPSGRTLYHAGSDSWGYWRIEAETYCSQWPPSDLWACYEVARRGDEIRFTGPGGDATVGRYRR